jgi:uncharacterized LabA/DUF88 family protein
MPDAGIRVPSDPHLRRWMLFVDGENLTIRAQRLAQDKHVPLQEGPYYMRDVLVWLPEIEATTRLLSSEHGHEELQLLGVRAYYYTSTTGDEDRIRWIREALWVIGFQPEVFKKPRTRDRTKGVDIALTTDLLGNAYRDNYDAAVLVAGDGDYVPLVEEVKRLGKVVHVVFFGETGHGLSPELRLASDRFWELEGVFAASWERHNSKE